MKEGLSSVQSVQLAVALCMSTCIFSRLTVLWFLLQKQREVFHFPATPQLHL